MGFLRTCQDSPKLLETVLSCIQHVVVIADLEGKILFVNSVVEEVFGFSPGELKGKNLSLMFCPDDLACLYPNLLYMAKKNKPFEGELMLVDKHDKPFFVFMVFRPCFDPEQDKTIMVISIRNIDKRKQLEKTLAETPYQDLIKLTDGIAHEVRNPLAAVGGAVNRLSKLCKKEGDHAGYFDRIFTNLSRIEGIIKKVEFFAHLPKPVTVEQVLGKMVEEAVKPYLSHIQDQNINLKTNLDDISLLVDKDLVVIAFSILIENALFALSPQGSLLINSRVEDAKCRVDVSDNGSGIAPENLVYIFKPFFSTKSDGTGLDLAVLKRIMEIHGGRVEVRSKLAEGTTFSLVFPLERRRGIRAGPLRD
jgi:PAS domain S-box-containing protein